MTRARRLRPFVWLTAGALIVFASGLDTRVHALRPALAREGAAPIGGPPPPGGGTNVALASAGAVASASSTYAAGFPAAGVINGDRSGANWGERRGLEGRDAGQLPGLGGGGLRGQLQHQSGERVFGAGHVWGAERADEHADVHGVWACAASTCSTGRDGVGDGAGRERDGEHAGVADGDVHAGDDPEDPRADDGRGRRLQPR